MFEFVCDVFLFGTYEVVFVDCSAGVVVWCLFDCVVGGGFGVGCFRWIWGVLGLVWGFLWDFGGDVAFFDFGISCCALACDLACDFSFGFVCVRFSEEYGMGVFMIFVCFVVAVPDFCDVRWFGVSVVFFEGEFGGRVPYFLDCDVWFAFFGWDWLLVWCVDDACRAA